MTEVTNRVYANGRNVEEIFAEIEISFISNQKKVLSQSFHSLKDWQKEQMNKISELNKRNMETLANYKDLIASSVRTDMENAYWSGAEKNDTMLAKAVTNGYKPPKKISNMKTAIASASAIGIFTSVIAEIRNAEIMSLYAAQHQYRELLAKVPYVMNSGISDISKAIDYANSDNLKKGLVGSVYANGAEINIASVVEGVVRNSAHKEMLLGAGERAAEYGVYTVLVSAHPTSCPLCYAWQNKVLLDDVNARGKPDGKHELLSLAVAEGLLHYNCRHTLPSFVEGFDKRIFGREIEKKDKNDEHYKRLQEQRHNERMIRQWKREAEGSLDAENREKANQKVEEWQARQRELIKTSNKDRLPLYRQSWREQIGGETKPRAVLTFDSKGDTINVREKVFNLSYTEAEHLKGKMTNEVARNYYVTHIGNIDDAIDKSLTIQEQAKQAFDMRNEARSFTRELMADGELVEILERDFPNKTWEGMLSRKKDKGLFNDKVFEDIIKTATEANKSVNKEFGIWGK